MKNAPIDITQILNKNGSKGPREVFDQEMKNEKYIKITPSSHPKLFIHLLNKANSISSDQTFSHTCKAKLRGSISHKFSI